VYPGGETTPVISLARLSQAAGLSSIRRIIFWETIVPP
jgi:hypothetical protein